jgi:glycerol-3-phosphate dehydrogenase
MAEDTLDHVERILGKRKPCSTRKTPLDDRNPQLLDTIRGTVSSGTLPPHSTLTETDVVYAVRHEAAIRLVDVLTRRSRLHLLHRDLAMECAESVSFIMQRELGWSESTRQQELQSYTDLCHSEIDAMREGIQ